MVKRTKVAFAIHNYKHFKQQMLNWANQFNICCFLDNNQYQTQQHSVECLVAVNAVESFTNGSIANFKAFESQRNDWLFGHVAYDFKNEIYPLTSSHADGIGFAKIYFFVPETVIELTEKLVTISCLNSQPNAIYQQINAYQPNTVVAQQTATTNNHAALQIVPKISKEKYLQTVQQLKSHILRGDCYEINFCQEFYANKVAINPVEVYQKLTNVSPNPLACYYKLNNQYLLCASPERYVKKIGNQIISQPIKGTYKRNLANTNIDQANKIALQNSHKDKTENVMVVDLVRNDLSKICTEGSVKVDELFGIYTFPQVHQMISTISATLLPNTSFANVLEASFPMGSMTGAPKLKVMQLTEQYEQTQRGIYSGCVGYIAPNKNFDFNVVIRSIMYNAQTQYLSYQVGGGITFNSNPLQEYEECLLKAMAMKQVLV